MKRAFISFDYDYDARLKDLLVGQAKSPDSPFEIADWSIKVASPTWRDEARKRIRASDVVIVLCGRYTHKATGVATELSIAKEERIPYFLLKSYKDECCTAPTTAASNDEIYRWTWDDLKSLIRGKR